MIFFHLPEDLYSYSYKVRSLGLVIWEAVMEVKRLPLRHKSVFKIQGHDPKIIIVWITFLQSGWNLKKVCSIILWYRTWGFTDHLFQMFNLTHTLHLALLTFSQSQPTCKSSHSCLCSAGMWFIKVRADRWAIWIGQCKHITFLYTFGGIHLRLLSLLFYWSNSHAYS